MEIETEYDWCKLQAERQKAWLGQLAPPVCNNGDHLAQERQWEKTLLNGGFDDGCWRWCRSSWAERIAGLQTLVSFCYPYWVKPLWIFLAKFVVCQTPGGWRSMTGGGNSVGHESLYNDSLGIYQLLTSVLRFKWVINYSRVIFLHDKVTTVHTYSTVYVWTSMTPN
jgi:hypothetical protein